MFRVRRDDHAPRVEMTPLIDVIFLLLTFFIYSLLVMVRAELLPVELTAVQTGEQAQPAQVLAITIDRAGALYINRQPTTDQELDGWLSRVTAEPDPPRVYLGMEVADPFSDRQVDRGPLLIGLIDRVRRAGIEDFHLIGEPASP